MMEYWNNGMLDGFERSSVLSIIPSFQYSGVIIL